MNTSQPQLNSLPDADLELLSAYIDGQLSPAERVLAERRLAGEPRLRAELDELRATASLLRGLEPVAPPRSFTIDPARAPRPRGLQPLAWFMQLGGGLAGLALVLLASLQLLTGGAGAPLAPAPAMQAQEAAAATQAPVSMAAPAAAATAAPAATAAAAAPAAAAEPSADPAAAAMTAPESTSREAPTEAAAGAPAADAAMKPAPTPMIAASDSSSPGTAELATPAVEAPARAAPGGPQPGLLLALGVALLALSLGSYLFSRSRA